MAISRKTGRENRAMCGRPKKKSPVDWTGLILGEKHESEFIPIAWIKLCSAGHSGRKAHLATCFSSAYGGSVAVTWIEEYHAAKLAISSSVSGLAITVIIGSFRVPAR